MGVNDRRLFGFVVGGCHPQFLQGVIREGSLVVQGVGSMGAVLGIAWGRSGGRRTGLIPRTKVFSKCLLLLYSCLAPEAKNHLVFRRRKDGSNMRLLSALRRRGPAKKV